MFTKKTSPFLYSTTLVLFSIFLINCTPDISENVQKSIQIEGDPTFEIPENVRHLPYHFGAISIKNTTKALESVEQDDKEKVDTDEQDLTVTINKIEFSETPQRFAYLGSPTGKTCPTDKDTECGAANAICLSKRCYSSDATVSIKIEPNHIKNLKFILKKDRTSDIKCPKTAPSDVPDIYQSAYCGKVTIHTTATNDAENVKKGVATFYLLKNQRSGEIKLNHSSLNFKGVYPNESFNKSFKIKNNGYNLLTINSIIITSDNSKLHDRIQLSENGSFELKPEEEKEISITVTPTEDDDNLDFNGKISILSSDKTESINLNITSETGGTGIGYLSAKGVNVSNSNPQTVEITNIGTQRLIIQEIKFNGGTLANEYTVKFGEDDQNMKELGEYSNSFPIDPNAKKKIKIEGDGSNKGVLTFISNSTKPEPIEIVVLGNSQEAGYLRISPVEVYLNHTQNFLRHFLIENLGTKKVKITNIQPDQTTTAFDFTPTGDTEIEPSDFVVGTIKLHSEQTSNIDNNLNISLDTTDSSFGTNEAPPRTDNKQFHTLTGNYNTQIEIKESNENPVVNQELRLRIKKDSAVTQNDICSWIIVKKPAASKIYVNRFGKEWCKKPLAFVPDAAGEYQFAASLSDTSNGAVEKLVTINVK